MQLFTQMMAHAARFQLQSAMRFMMMKSIKTSIAYLIVQTKQCITIRRKWKPLERISKNEIIIEIIKELGKYEKLFFSQQQKIQKGCDFQL